MTTPNFKPIGLRRRIRNMLLQQKFSRRSRKAARRRNREIDALVKKARNTSS